MCQTQESAVVVLSPSLAESQYVLNVELQDMIEWYSPRGPSNLDYSVLRTSSDTVRQLLAAHELVYLKHVCYMKLYLRKGEINFNCYLKKNFMQ